MHFLRLTTITLLSSFVPYTFAHQRSLPTFSVEIQPIGKTKVKATVKNTNSISLRLLKEGTILDDVPVQKLQIQHGAPRSNFTLASKVAGSFAEDQEDNVTFAGIRKRIKLNDLSGSAFTVIAPGASIKMEVDMA